MSTARQPRKFRYRCQKFVSILYRTRAMITSGYIAAILISGVGRYHTIHANYGRGAINSARPFCFLCWNFLWSPAIYSAATIMFYGYFFLFISYYGRALFIALRPLCFTSIFSYLWSRASKRAQRPLCFCAVFSYSFFFFFYFFYFFFFLFSLSRNL
jgi:hypothetical protein